MAVRVVAVADHRCGRGTVAGRLRCELTVRVVGVDGDLGLARFWSRAGGGLDQVAAAVLGAGGGLSGRGRGALLGHPSRTFNVWCPHLLAVTDVCAHLALTDDPKVN